MVSILVKNNTNACWLCAIWDKPGCVYIWTESMKTIICMCVKGYWLVSELLFGIFRCVMVPARDSGKCWSVTVLVEERLLAVQQNRCSPARWTLSLSEFKFNVWCWIPSTLSDGATAPGVAGGFGHPAFVRLCSRQIWRLCVRWGLSSFYQLLNSFVLTSVDLLPPGVLFLLRKKLSMNLSVCILGYIKNRRYF